MIQIFSINNEHHVHEVAQTMTTSDPYDHEKQLGTLGTIHKPRGQIFDPPPLRGHV